MAEVASVPVPSVPSGAVGQTTPHLRVQRGPSPAPRPNAPGSSSSVWLRVSGLELLPGALSTKAGLEVVQVSSLERAVCIGVFE